MHDHGAALLMLATPNELPHFGWKVAFLRPGGTTIEKGRQRRWVQD